MTVLTCLYILVYVFHDVFDCHDAYNARLMPVSKVREIIIYSPVRCASVEKVNNLEKVLENC